MKATTIIGLWVCVTCLGSTTAQPDKEWNHPQSILVQPHQLQPPISQNPNLNNLNSEGQPTLEQSKRIQLVFCLDVTGSMGGLIATAKQKIWSIASSLLQADPKPELQIGMVFYRDRGDDFVTKRIEFTEDIDSVYGKLMDMVATGGGDSPESVNQALFDAVNKFQWYADTAVYKAVFQVGDCPPHMDYQNDVKYPVTCREAVKKGIYINTLKMGNCAGAEQVWREVAMITGGDYIPVDQNANGYVLTTPYDDDIARLQNTIDNTVVYYGTYTIRVSKESSKVQANDIYSKGKSSENASRAEYKTTKGVTKDVYFKNDLVTDYANGVVKVDTIRKELLSETLQPLTVAQRTAYLQKMKADRDSARAALQLNISKRNEYIKTKTASESDVSSNSFSNKVYSTMKKQTGGKGIELKGTVKE
jgi:hypothetical protein